MRLKILRACALALTLAACASEAPSPAPAPPPAAPAPSSPAPMSPAPEAPPPASRPSSRDMCGAEAVQNLVGRPRTEIPVPVLPALQRVACVTCPVTMDFNPRRLNFFYDADTGIIKEIRCG